MTPTRFAAGGLAAARRTIRTALVALATLVAAACAGGDRIHDRQPGQQYVCHDGKETLAVSTADMFVHQQHGDALGPCPHDG